MSTISGLAYHLGQILFFIVALWFAFSVENSDMKVLGDYYTGEDDDYGNKDFNDPLSSDGESNPNA
jgi:hypothetical protein